MAESLERMHLADLHERARRLGIRDFRLLPRPELVAAIAERSDAEPEPEPVADEEPRERSAEREGSTGRRESRRGRERLRSPRAEPAEDAGEEVTGILEITPQKHGFIRVAGTDVSPDDVYISASQIRRCELRSGDEVSGPVRGPRRGERHRALVHVNRVNGGEPPTGKRPDLDSMTPVVPNRRVALDSDPRDVLLRAVDLLTPLALGQRVLVAAAPRSGRTTLLRGIARALAGQEGVELTVLLVDERPEEATAWRGAAPDAQLCVATAEMPPTEHLRVARAALESARRRAEAGSDAVLLVDSLSRLAFAAQATAGRDPLPEVAEVKRLFGSGRALADEGAGSLTVVATVVEGADDDGLAERSVLTTESSLIRLDPALAAAGVFPALDLPACRVSNEEELRPSEELAAVRRLRSLLADLAPGEAAAYLRERIEATTSNAELLAAL